MFRFIVEERKKKERAKDETHWSTIIGLSQARGRSLSLMILS